MHLLQEHGADAVRYWAASGRLGADMTFDPGQLRVGRRLASEPTDANFRTGLETIVGGLRAEREVLAEREARQ